MTQNRLPPAYQEYAAAMMARVEYRTMTLPERGLLYTMRLELWVNRTLPSDPTKLAKLLGFDRSEVQAALSAVLAFFQDAGGLLSCPELENYRAHLTAIRTAQSSGGKRGAKLTNELKSKPGNPSGNSTGEPRVLSTDQSSSTQSSQTQSSMERDPFLDEYIRAEEREQATASRIQRIAQPKSHRSNNR